MSTPGLSALGSPTTRLIASLDAEEPHDQIAQPGWRADRCAPGGGLVMLVHDFIDVPFPIDVVERLLVSSDDLSTWAAAAYQRGERLAVGPGVAGVTAAVELEVGEPVRGTESISIPFAWRVANAVRLFPHMEAELVISPLTDESTHLTLRGRYTPPFASLGEVLDRLAMHRIAEATVRNFLERLAGAVVEQAEELGLEAEFHRDGGTTGA